MRALELLVVLCSVVTIRAAIDQPGHNVSVNAAGFGSNIISGFNSIVNRFRGPNNSTNSTAPSTRTNVTGINITALPPGAICPPPVPDYEVIL